jgi:hypothetical protein
MAQPMKDNKAVKMLKAAEEGGYGVVGVVSVCPHYTVEHSFRISEGLSHKVSLSHNL